ncbi:MAG: hypothetical protein JXK07_00960, partial [Spirochaetes bacterium]|nr:hypothetical protein [Spirochaetota bacterium]
VIIQSSFCLEAEHTEKRGYLVHYANYSEKNIMNYSLEYNVLYVTGYSVKKDGSVRIVSSNFHNLCKKTIPATKFTPVITFDSAKSGSTIFNNNKLRSQLVNSLSDFLNTNSFKNIQFDFEHLPPSDADHYRTFLSELRMKNRYLHISICLFPQVKWIDKYSKFTDISVLADSADEFMLMSYDQHGKTQKEGPVTSLSWAEDNIRYIIKHIAAQKLILGVPLYGYSWDKDGKRSVITEKSFYRRFKPKEIAHLKEGISILDKPETYGYTYLSVGDSKTADYFLQLAKKYNLKGTAIWRLGFEK